MLKGWSQRVLRPVCAVIAMTSAAGVVPSAALAAEIQASAPAFTAAHLVGSARLPSTAHDGVVIHVALTRADGTPALAGHPVRAVVARGDAHFGLGESSVEALTDERGQVVLSLVPGPRHEPLLVHLSSPNSDAASADVEIPLVAPVSTPLVVGVATLGAGPVPGWVESPDGAPNGTTTRRGMASLYANGQVARNTQATVAYNTADTLSQSTVSGPFTDNPNDRPFPIYGDASSRYDDALSRNHLYANVRNGGASAGYGEFYAQGTSADVAGGYSTLVNGVRAHGEGNALSLGGFTSRNDIAYDRRLISPTGLGIANGTLRPDIVVGSDVLTLVRLDRRSGAVVGQQLLTRGTDYVIDYASGLLRFVNVILPFDAFFNPQLVVAQYEYGGAGARSTMAGLSGSLKLDAAANTRIDSWYLNDATGGGNLTLLGEALSGKLPAGSWTVSHERSSGFLPVSQIAYGDGGDAYRTVASTRVGKVAAGLRFSSTSAGYENPYGSYTTPGLTSIDALLSDDLSSNATLALHLLTAKNTLPQTFATTAVANADVQAEAKVTVRATKRVAYHLGVRDSAASSNGAFSPLFLATGNAGAGAGTALPFDPTLPAPLQYQAGAGHSLDLLYGLDWTFAPRLSIAAERTSPLSAGYDPYDPPSTRAELDYDLGGSAKAFVRQLWQRASIAPLAVTQQTQTYPGTATSSTSAGIEAVVGDTTYQSSYAVDHTANGSDLYDALGVRRRFTFAKQLSGDVFVQVGQSLLSSSAPPGAGASPYFVAYGTSLSYAKQSFRASAQVQIRSGYLGGSTFALGAAGPISPAVSLFGTFGGSYTQLVTNDELRFGLSYRPSRNDRYVTLATVDSQRSNLTNYDGYVTNVAQIQELYRPSSRTELAGSLGYKLTGDAYFAPRTSIYGLRADQRLGARFDVAGEYHRSSVAPLAGLSATGLALEGGVRLGDSLRLAAGYNFSGFTDPAVATSPTHRGAYLTLSSYIDRVFGWGKGERP